MSLETEFYLKMVGVFVAAGLMFKYMMYLQDKKQKEADAKFEFTMKLIEMRNKTIGDKDEPKKTT